MIKMSVEKVKLLHQLMAEATGGSVGIRDESLLDSAIETAFATFDGNELYPGKEEKAAKLCHSLVSNHAFVDGNKRIGVYVMLSFLELNGIKIEASDEDVVVLGLGVADGSMSQDDILAWIKDHIVSVVCNLQTTEGLSDFAGQIRDKNISKGGFSFANCAYFEDIFARFHAMPDFNIEEIIDKYIELNFIHP